MADWSHFDREIGCFEYPYANQIATTSQEYPSRNFTVLLSPPGKPSDCYGRGDSPRELRNKAEKQRRDKMNKSISHLASLVPPVAIPARKIDKTSVLRLTAHYLRSHQYVFGDSLDRVRNSKEFSCDFTKTLLKTLKGFLITVTYKGIFVVVSPNVEEYLGYTELDLLGNNIYNYVHESDHAVLREQLTPPYYMLGTNGQLLIPDEPDGKKKIAEELVNEKRSFIIRFKRLNQQRSGPIHFLSCHIEGTFRKADRACHHNNKQCHIVRRARYRGEKPTSSGNDIVFIGVARPATETFMTEKFLESFKMEYRTRHSIDGQIIQCEQRIALVTGYMTHEVSGVNAMNFMHRDDVRWVIIALREMYDENRLYGESCYRLMTKNGQFIYMRTRGHLDVDKDTNAVTSFVCTNTVVNEREGKELIRLMKKKFMLLLNNGDTNELDDINASEENSSILPVEDPEQLQEVILHLVTNLPSSNNSDNVLDSQNDINFSRLSIIPPRRDRILNAILRSSSVIGNVNHMTDANSEAGCSGNFQLTDNKHDDDTEPPTKLSRNYDDISDESLMEVLKLDPNDQLKITEIDTHGINYKDVLEEAYQNKKMYFNNINN
ncbi:aryl hydrocarbon receptor nuclear translocator-like protein 1 [Pieris rapae]|uniref:aryl hydrocarbon receptor nuclear translocator-like protein 1 n=1 Tax=Pieris rapae TaxID=64459 RepID=UPI001E27FB33|nr:aryl hydrocarbon receptor nuclear translocator-like protein 1 [Pieris rapae]